MKRYLIILLTITLSGCLRSPETVDRTAAGGVLDLTGIPLDENRVIPLGGEWFFSWQEFLPPLGPSRTETEPRSGELTAVPGNWTESGRYNAEGYATYRLYLTGLIPGKIYGLYIPEAVSAYRLFLNRRELASNGTPGKSAEQSRPSYQPRTAAFTAEEGINVLTVHVSNFHYRKSGIWRDYYLGTARGIGRMRQKRLMIDTLLISILAFVSLYHIGLFLFRREEKAELYFGFICLVLVIRLLTTGEQLLTWFFPAFPWEIARRMEFSPFYLAAALTPLFLKSLFPAEANRTLIRIYVAGSGVFGVIFLLLPVRISNRFIPPGEVYLLIGLAYGVYLIIRGIINRRMGSLLILSAMLILVLSVINDMLYSNQVISSFYLAPVGFILFIVIQALMLSRRYAFSFYTIENLTHNLKEFNQSLSRFVPFQFLEYLKKNSILEVYLGDQVHEEMTILFADIRSFTTLSEGMTPEENFRFLNSFLSYVVPVIREEGGFVDKFMGDGIMALFPPHSADQGLQAAIRLQKSVIEYNKARDRAGYRNIRLGIGLHTGGIMLGTIGETDRMETTVISDTVNIASRMEELTKTFGASIIISHAMFEKLKEPEKIHYRSLGSAPVKGKRRPLPVMEILDGLEEEEFGLKKTDARLFEQSVIHLEQGRLDQAASGFQTILNRNPADRAAALFLEKCHSIPSDPEEA